MLGHLVFCKVIISTDIWIIILIYIWMFYFFKNAYIVQYSMSYIDQYIQQFKYRPIYVPIFRSYMFSYIGHYKTFTYIGQYKPTSLKLLKSYIYRSIYADKRRISIHICKISIILAWGLYRSDICKGLIMTNIWKHIFSRNNYGLSHRYTVFTIKKQSWSVQNSSLLDKRSLRVFLVVQNY